MPILDAKSWVRPSELNETWSEELLQHEIGHYNIAKVWARELRMVLKNTNFSYRNCEEMILKIDDDMRKKYFSMQEQYDNETNHFNDKEQQKIWNTRIKKLMRAYL